ncbi:5-deoxy-glucuronate isomerase [Tepidanaerobacter sp. GT38]|uniref:5-deoxy-glucuronate isomerase n=1 Tax=Tepidanaerobacter sp. GT38 TaxID=2722793 RepID=UPI001F017F4F|nr:5-deoxy-glucuronate isomerase [Tepidanaerobacter sp. GT38]MCG1011921.1 5-deoxy-glucuronate isomerase [Tepidanaerobacter sp. GT38]
MSYLYPNKNVEGYTQIVKAGKDLNFCGFGLLKLKANETHELKTEDEEAVLVILSGKCHVTVNGQKFTDLGERKDVFSGNPTSVYIPIHSSFKVEETQGLDLEVAVVSAKAEKKFEPFVVRPEEVVCNHRGILNYQRDVRDIIVDNAEGKVHRIVVGETISYPGQWSSYPSHKHDKHNPPYEANLEEVYYFKVKPEGGFGVQVMYNDDLTLREAYMIKDGDTVILPEGYHPVAAAPGFQVYYLWVMAGGYGRKLIPNDDPNLLWLHNVGPLLK